LDHAAHLFSKAEKQRKSRDLSNVIRLNPYSKQQNSSCEGFSFESDDIRNRSSTGDDKEKLKENKMLPVSY